MNTRKRGSICSLMPEGRAGVPFINILNGNFTGNCWRGEGSVPNLASQNDHGNI